MQRLIDITIDQDWTPVREVFHSLNSRRLSGELDSKKQGSTLNGLTSYVDGDVTIRIGADTVPGSGTYKNGWININGPKVEVLLPWAVTARELFKEINFVNMVWAKTDAPTPLHTDYLPYDNPDDPFYIDPINSKRQQCKLIYIISADDPNAVTVSYDPDDASKTWLTPSTPSRGFLLDTGYPHEVKNTGYREIFRFLFDTDYQTVSDFFDRQGPIRF